MRSIFKQLSVVWAHIFIVFAGMYALPHTVWSASTIMQGSEPIFGLAWIGWAFSGLLLGITIDVGQIVISIQIARGEGTASRLTAFAGLSMIVFYLQFYYAIAHVPITPLGMGMQSVTSPLVISMQNLGPWIVSLSIPLITMVYTFEHRRKVQPVQTATITRQTKTETIKVEKPEQPRITGASVPQIKGEVYTAQCLICAYSATKTTQARADAALRFHMRTHQRVEVEQ